MDKLRSSLFKCGGLRGVSEHLIFDASAQVGVLVNEDHHHCTVFSQVEEINELLEQDDIYCEKKEP